ncbi:MAG: chemotaxis protein CheW [Eubacteriales bacterium]
MKKFKRSGVYTMDDTSKYRELFFEETDEYLQTLNDCLLQLERETDDKGIIDEIFRAAHTLKGMAATMGYKTMTELTHRMENVLELFRNGSLPVTSDVVSIIFSCLDQLSEIVEDLRVEKYIEYDMGELFQRLDEIANGSIKVEGKKNEEVTFNVSNEMISDTDSMIIKSAHEKNYYAYHIAVKITKDCLLKAARAYLVVNRLEQQGDIIQTSPSTEKIEEGDFENVFKLIYLTKNKMDEVEEIIVNISEIEEVIIEEIEDPVFEDEVAATVALQIEEEGSRIEESLLPQTKQAKKSIKNEEKNSVHHINQSIRVDLSRLDSFMNLVSELVIYRTRLEELSNQYKTTEINEPLEHVARITSDLQDLVLRIRMQPVNVVFNRFPRMIRDLSQELGKEINLIIEGEDTELDRTVVSELGEPLVHIMRNAADHGIESMQDRLVLGKPKVGVITLTAYQEGNKVVITVSDDGKGINPEVIKASAARKGIHTEGMGEKDLIQLIFNQGFSTVEKVTNVSGRGVGMDVVRQKISSLGGNIEVISEVDKGSTFIIKLPLTLSIIQALMVKIGKETFALPLGVIEKVVKVTQKEIVHSHNHEVYMYREKAIPVIRVNRRLHIESFADNQHIIIVFLGRQYYGLVVDDLIGQQEIVIKKLSGNLKGMKEYVGATILGNGDITLILDVGNLCNERKGEEFE